MLWEDGRAPGPVQSPIASGNSSKFTPACVWSQSRFTLRASLEGKIHCQKNESSACPDFGGEGGFVCISSLAGKLEKYRPEKPIPPSPSPPPKFTSVQPRKMLDRHRWGPMLCGRRLGTFGHVTVALWWAGAFGNGAEGRAKVPGWGLGAPARHLCSPLSHPWDLARSEPFGATTLGLNK